ncbi:hypothetical protein HMPREF1544_05603 [Mucor circinelloides 1006PhL]|uniref:Chitosanase n=1 Tax=Mucor circinelloides f. circinelloides (strain 1006PhL) TaxID=1220926 RepID=S2JCS9_MUCC1|nr:hypothetical protein HMPREF1544_05603 [Mucor circinelloides 1006PhL]KAG1106174.1 hypothetical protein G6F42_016852 [Rhizopus arrhizus]
MKFLSISALFLVLILASNSLQQELDEEVYQNCHNRFQPHPAMCNKFNFMSSEEAVKKGCIVPKNGTTFYDLSDLPLVNEMNANTIKMASLITNVFEDGDSNFAFASCSNIQDLRGFTSGYAGFTTGTGDSETLIQLYSQNHPNNRLQQFLPRCHEISSLPHCDRQSRGTTQGLEQFCTAWKEEACDANGEFAKTQRQWVFENYMIPSARYAAQSGVTSALGQAIFYDTIIQHGFQYVEPDINIVRVLTLTGPRMRLESEQDYLTRFITTRRELQCCYPDKVWPASASRSADLQSLVDEFEKYKNLDGPIPLVKFGREIKGDENLDRDEKHCK